MNTSLEIFVGMPLFFINDEIKQMNNTSWYFTNYIHEEPIENISVIYKDTLNNGLQTCYLEVMCKNHVLNFQSNEFKYIKYEKATTFNISKCFYDMTDIKFFVDEDFLINQNAFSQRIFAFNKLMDEMI
jgi:hypothetical protein